MREFRGRQECSTASEEGYSYRRRDGVSCRLQASFKKNFRILTAINRYLYLFDSLARLRDDASSRRRADIDGYNTRYGQQIDMKRCRRAGVRRIIATRIGAVFL